MPDEQVEQPQPQQTTPPETTVEPERPPGLPENFKTVEDFANSYSELKRSFDERNTELNDLRQTVEQWQQQAAEPQYDPAEVNDALMSAYEADPIGTIAQISQRAAAMQVQQALSQQQQQQEPLVEQQYALMATEAERLVAADPQFGDYGVLRDKISTVLQEMPNLVPENAGLNQMVGGLKAAYNIALATELRARAEQQAQAPAPPAPDPGLVARSQATTLAGSGGRPPVFDPNETKWEDIQNASIPSYSALAK